MGWSDAYTRPEAFRAHSSLDPIESGLGGAGRFAVRGPDGRVPEGCSADPAASGARSGACAERAAGVIGVRTVDGRTGRSLARSSEPTGTGRTASPGRERR